MASTIGRGLLAGAVGTALLNAVTYLDMALTDREPSSAPAETASRALEALGVGAPDGSNRRDAVGAVAGIATGLGIGVVASVVRRAGLRLPAPVGAVATGGLAMAASDGPMAALGVSDPRTWTAVDWTRDVLPHLAYGVGVRWTLDRTERPAPAAVPAAKRGRSKTAAVAGAAVSTLVSHAPVPSALIPDVLTGGVPDVPEGDGSRPRPRGRTLSKCLLIGLAAGGRSSFGLSAPLLTSASTRARILGVSSVLGEMVLDKLPATPSRLDTGPLGGRVLAGAVGGATVAARSGHTPLALIGATLGVAGSVTGSVLGAAWREVAANNGLGWPAAVAEDVLSLSVAAYALN